MEICIVILSCVGMTRMFAVINNVILIVTGNMTLTNYITAWLNVSGAIAVIIVYTTIVILNFSLFMFIKKKRNERII
jgi:hypothetical protein